MQAVKLTIMFTFNVNKFMTHVSVSGAHPFTYALPSFVDTPVNVTAYRGTNAILPCAVINLGPKLVSNNNNNNNGYL